MPWPAWARTTGTSGKASSCGATDDGAANGMPGPVWTMTGIPSSRADSNTVVPSAPAGFIAWPIVCSLTATNPRSVTQRLSSAKYAPRSWCGLMLAIPKTLPGFASAIAAIRSWISAAEGAPG